MNHVLEITARPLSRIINYRLTLFSTLAFSLLSWFMISIVTPHGLSFFLIALLLSFIFCGIGITFLSFFSEEISLTSLFLSLGIGFIISGAISQIFVYQGISLIWVLPLLFVISMRGIVIIKQIFSKTYREPVTFAIPFIILINMVFVVYYLPVSLREGVSLAGGNYQWMYIDSVFHEAIASIIRNETHPISDPSFHFQTLSYHIGPYALAASIAKTFSFSTGDTVPRIVRAIGLMSLILSALAFGRNISEKNEHKEFTAFISIFSLFFLSGIFSIFMPSWDSSRAIEEHLGIRSYLGYLINPDIYKAHFFSGSGLWAAIVLITGSAILIRPKNNTLLHPLIILAPLTLCFNIIAGFTFFLACFGVLLFSKRYSLSQMVKYFIISSILLTAVYIFGGFINSNPTLFNFSSMPSFTEKGFHILTWFFLGIGIKLIAFTNICNENKETSLSFVCFMLGYTIFYLCFSLFWGGEDYALIFMSLIASVYASRPLSRLLLGVLQNFPQNDISRLKFLLDGFLIVTITCISIFLVLKFFYLPGKTYFIIGILCIFLAVSFWFLINHILKSSVQFTKPFILLPLGILICISSFGFIKIVNDYGWNAIGVEVTCDSDRYKSLIALKDNSSSHSLIATQHHEIEKIRVKPARSYMYSAITGRNMLLEGWEYGNIENHPRFSEVKNDNEALFLTSSATTAKQIVNKYNITHIIAEPGTKLPYYSDTLNWLKEIPNKGSLKLYAVLSSFE